MPEIAEVLGTGRAGTRRPGRWWLYVIVIVLVGLLAAAWLWSGDDGATVRYETVAVARGDLTVTVTATGTLQPVNQVDVGTEISGTVRKVEVNFNDRVRRGQVLARLDTDALAARERQSQAALALAEAAAKEAAATVLETRAKLGRAKELAQKKLNTAEELDTAQATHDRALAGLDRAHAQVDQARAQLDADRTALAKAVIRAPIDGMVLKRQIEEGQTVAASLQTPVLFTLAENLAQMELRVAVDEADVGQVRDGQSAVFSVDAYPGRDFPATITQVRHAPQIVEGVVTYETVMSVQNEDLALRPGMTATAEITTQQLQDALLVPNAALRFTPPHDAAPQQTTLLSALFPRRSRGADRQARTTDGGQRRVWTLVDGGAVTVPVQTGATDGRMTEVVSGDLAAGARVIVDATVASK